MWTLTLFRLFAGIQNALYYAQLKYIARVWSAILVLYIIWMMPNLWALSAIVVPLSLLSFEGKLWNGSIHFFEMFKTSIPIACYFLSGGNLFDIAIATYPGLVLHKMAINLGSGQKLLSDVTDDPTGRSYTFTVSIKWKWAVNWIHFFWFKVKGMADARQAMFEQANPGWTKIWVPRQTMADRLIWTGISIILYFTIDGEFYFSDLLNWFK